MTYFRNFAIDVQLLLELSTFAVILLVHEMMFAFQYLVKDTYIQIPELS